MISSHFNLRSLALAPLTKSLVVLWVLLAFSAQAQPNPSPGKPQTRPVWITGATIHDAVQAPYQGVVGFENGQLIYVGRGAEIRLDPERAEIIDASGQHIY
ncbi:MAG: hypothetical protein ACKOQP_02510, partial [Bacteroidota bacterium]